MVHVYVQLAFFLVPAEAKVEITFVLEVVGALKDFGFVFFVAVVHLIESNTVLNGADSLVMKTINIIYTRRLPINSNLYFLLTDRTCRRILTIYQ